MRIKAFPLTVCRGIVNGSEVICQESGRARLRLKHRDTSKNLSKFPKGNTTLVHLLMVVAGAFLKASSVSLLVTLQGQRVYGKEESSPVGWNRL